MENSLAYSGGGCGVFIDLVPVPGSRTWKITRTWQLTDFGVYIYYLFEWRLKIESGNCKAHSVYIGWAISGFLARDGYY